MASVPVETESAARELKKNLSETELDFIPYGGTLPAIQDVIGGNLDLAVGWVADSKQWVEVDKLNVIGISGTKDLPQYKSFSSQKVKGFEDLVGNYLIMASTKVPDDVAEELHRILKKGAQSSISLQTYLDADVCAGSNYNWNQTQDVYKRWQQYWPEKFKTK